MNRSRRSGFSLLELLVALMIIAVIGTLGLKQYGSYSAKARYIKAQDTLKTVSEGLDQYFLKHGKYPDFTSFEAMVDGGSPLVKENLIPVNVSAKDPWGTPFEGSAGKGTYTLKGAGDPNGNPDLPAFVREPGKVTGGDGITAPAETKPAEGTAK